MVRSGLGEHFVGRSGEVLVLGDLLEVRLRIHVEGFLEDIREGGEYVFLHEGFRCTVSEIEVERSEECLEGIGDDVGIGISSSEEFAFGDEYIILETEL